MLRAWDSGILGPAWLQATLNDLEVTLIFANLFPPSVVDMSIQCRRQRCVLPAVTTWTQIESCQRPKSLKKPEEGRDVQK